MANPRGDLSIYSQVGLQDPLRGNLTHASEGQVVKTGTPVTNPIKILRAYSTNLLSGLDAPMGLVTGEGFELYHGVSFVYGHRGTTSPALGQQTDDGQAGFSLGHDPGWRG